MFERDSSLESSGPTVRATLIFQHLKVQNANTIASPLTWGFPAITAFTGLMTALERRIGTQGGLKLYGVGVICHSCNPQVTRGGYVRKFCLTRNPVKKDGETAAIVEEGRVHLDLTLVFDAELSTDYIAEEKRAAVASHVADLLSGMRLAGGSVMPDSASATRQSHEPQLRLIPDDDDERLNQFKQMSRRWLPGFALVSRDELLVQRLQELRGEKPSASVLDAWLSLSCLTQSPVVGAGENYTPESDGAPSEWQIEGRSGWVVPIPVGYAALSELYPPGHVSGARDLEVSFRFVESVYSIGQWISPYRLKLAEQLFWYPVYDTETALYRCYNKFEKHLDSVP